MDIKVILKYLLRVACIVFVIWLVMYSGFSFRDNDVMKYDGDKYLPIEYNQDIFAYYYIGDSEYGEEGEVSPVEGSKFDMVQCEGDLYCLKDEQEAAQSYYSSDENFIWSVAVDTEDDIVTCPLEVTEEEMGAVYGIENQEKDQAIFFDEIEAFATLTKTSKDGIVSGVTELAYYEGNWYWRSEIIDESREKDGDWPEYVYAIPETLSQKITDAIN